MSSGVIHYCGYASQPDIRICCDNTWTTPAWKQLRTVPCEGVYLADDMRFYTFDENRVTCKKCMRMQYEMCSKCGLTSFEHIAVNRDEIHCHFCNGFVRSRHA